MSKTPMEVYDELLNNEEAETKLIYNREEFPNITWEEADEIRRMIHSIYGNRSKRKENFASMDEIANRNRVLTIGHRLRH